jgi:RNA polymerase sigma-70 factor (ECF subfamily)
MRGLALKYTPARMSQARDASVVEAEAAAELVRRIQGGDSAAEAELVERYSRGVLFLLRRITKDPALAEDLHQETFVVVLERLRRGGLEQPEKLAGFLRATARNLFTGSYRKTARRETYSDSEQVERAVDGRKHQLHAVLRQERASAVRQALSELRTDRDRQILYRFYLLEEAKETICAEFGLSDLHFNRVLFRARQRFKEILESGGLGWVVAPGSLAGPGAVSP